MLTCLEWWRSRQHNAPLHENITPNKSNQLHHHSFLHAPSQLPHNFPRLIPINRSRQSAPPHPIPSTDSVKTLFPQRDNSRVPSNHFYLLTFKNRHPNAMLICANCLSNIHRLAQVKLPAKRTSSGQHSTIPDAPARNASPQAIVINHANQKVHNQHEHHFANHFHGTFAPVERTQLKLERNYLNYYRRRASVGNRSLGLRTCQIGTCRREVAPTQATLAHT